MPDVFLSEAEFAASQREALVFPVFGSTVGFRFRHDAILRGFAQRPELADPRAEWAVEFFNDYLLDFSERTSKVKLESGDVLIANNHRVLHARTDFRDSNRLLWRARWPSGSGDRMKMRQLSPPSVDTAQYQWDQKSFFTSLEKTRPDVEPLCFGFQSVPFSRPGRNPAGAFCIAERPRKER